MIKLKIPSVISSALCLVLPLLSAFCGSGAKSPGDICSISCGGDYTLILGVHKEFVELSYVSVYNLYLQKNPGGEKRLITGENAVLPRVRRYLDMIIVRDFEPGKTGSIFDYHWVDPSVFTRQEFNIICDCFEKNRDRFAEIKDGIGALVYGNHRLFRETFRLPDGYFIVTEIDGNLSIVTDPSFANMTEVPEKRHFNNIGFFDNSNILHIRKGKIISGEMKGFYGKPVKQVNFVTADGSVDYTGEVEVLWSDILYSADKTGVNSDYIFSAKNSDGKKLNEVFRITPAFR